MTQPDAPRPRPRPRPEPAVFAPSQPVASPTPAAQPQPPTNSDHPANPHRTLMAVLVVIALGLAGAVVWLMVRTDTTGQKRVALPVRFTDYERADRAADVVRAVRALLPPNVAASAAGGAYQRDGGSGPTPLAVVVVSAATLADSRASVDTFPDLVARTSGGKPYVVDIDGSTVICGRAKLAGALRTVCGWGNNTTSGLFVASSAVPGPADLAGVVQRFLAEVEH